MDDTHTEQRIQTVCLLALCLVAIAGAMYWLRPIMIPLVLAVFLSFVLAPFVDTVVRDAGAPRPLAVAVTLFLVFLVFWLIWALVATSMTQLSENADKYREGLISLPGVVTEHLPASLLGGGTDAEDKLRMVVLEFFQTVLVGSTKAALDIVSKGVLVLIFVSFMLLGGATAGAGGKSIWNDAKQRIRRYAVTKMAVSAITGGLVGTVLALLGVDMALAFGFCAFLLNFIPNVGSILATLLPLPVVMLSADLTPVVQVLAILLPGIIQISIGNIIEPKIMGDSFGLHPIAILASLVFWGMLWGIVGMFLATPITAIVKSVFERMEHTAPIADLLAGKLTILDRE